MAIENMSVYSPVLVLLGGAVIAAPLAKRIGLGTVIGYLAAGVLIGPIFSLITGGEKILHFAELGVVLLLFVIGLELKPRDYGHCGGKFSGLGCLKWSSPASF